jgi:hypothetical protein
MAGIDEYSTTPASNTQIATIDIAENCLPGGINNALRQLMADVRAFANDVGGKAVSAGTDTVTLATATGYTAYADGTILAFIVGGTNTGAATLNVDGVGAKAIRKGADVAVAAGDLVAGMAAIVIYDASANTAAGAWMLVNPATVSLDADLTSWAAVVRASGFDTFVATPSGANFKALLSDDPLGSDIGGTGNGFTKFTGPTTSEKTFTLPNASATILTSELLTARGDIIVRDASVPVRLAKGTALQLLGNDGTDVAWVNGGTRLLAQGSVSSAATLDIVLTGYTAYRGIKIFLTGFRPATDAVTLGMRVSTDGGSTYDTAATGYEGHGNLTRAGTNFPFGSLGTDRIPMAFGGTCGNGAAEGGTWEITMTGQTKTALWPRMHFIGSYISSDATPLCNCVSGGGSRDTAQDTDAVRFLFSSGDIAAGDYAVYGLI